MSGRTPRLTGVELYLDDRAQATRCYRDTLGLRLRESDPQRSGGPRCVAGPPGIEGSRAAGQFTGARGRLRLNT
jgi:hypothetical protein